MNKNGIIGMVAATILTGAIVFGAVKFNPDLAPDPQPAPAPVEPADPADPNAANIVLNQTPADVKAGDLVELNASSSNADSIAWKVVPATTNFKVVDGGRRAFFSHGATGEFLFVVAASKAGTVDVMTFTIKVNGGAVTPQADLASKIPGWCNKVQSPTKRDEAIKLAQSFSSVAAIIKPTMSGQDIVDATKKSNQDALGANVKNWEPFLLALQAELKSQSAAGTLTDAESHAKAWRAIADGLNRYANTL